MVSVLLSVVLSPATKAESRSCDKTRDLKRRGGLTLWLFKKKFEVPAIKGSVSILPQNHRQLLKVMPFGTVRDYFGGAPKSLQMVTATMKSKDACSLEEKL